MARTAARPRRTPQRTCVACRRATDKRELVRIVRRPDGRVEVDPTGKAPGRGAYLCGQPGCWENATKKKLLDKALRTAVDAEDAKEIVNFGRTKVSGEAV